MMFKRYNKHKSKRVQIKNKSYNLGSSSILGFIIKKKKTYTKVSSAFQFLPAQIFSLGSLWNKGEERRNSIKICGI